MPGPLPKDPRLRRARNKTATRTTIDGVPPVVPQRLPPRAKGDPWHRRTRAMWATLWASPLAREWVDADLPGLHRLAQLDHDFWTATDPAVRARLASAINTLSRNYGLDPMSRRSLQWEIKRAAATPAGTPHQPAAQPTRPRDPRLAVVPPTTPAAVPRPDPRRARA